MAQKFFSRTLQILGFIAESGQYGQPVLGFSTVSIQIIIKALVVVSKQPTRDQSLWLLTGIGPAGQYFY